MKRAVILHGTDGNPAANWFPWLKEQLIAAGYEVWVPLLPNNHTPNRNVYNDFLFGTNWNFNNNLVVGHSSGAVSVLNLLQDKRCPLINCGVLVGAWAHLNHTDLDREQFKDMFPPKGFDFKTIKAKTNKLVYLHGEKDPYCPLDQAKWLATQTDSDITIVPNGLHLGVEYTEFPELLNLLSDNKLL